MLASSMRGDDTVSTTSSAMSGYSVPSFDDVSISKSVIPACRSSSSLNTFGIRTAHTPFVLLLVCYCAPLGEPPTIEYQQSYMLHTSDGSRWCVTVREVVEEYQQFNIFEVLGKRDGESSMRSGFIVVDVHVRCSPPLPIEVPRFVPRAGLSQSASALSRVIPVHYTSPHLSSTTPKRLYCYPPENFTHYSVY